MNDAPMTIGALAERTGVSVKTIRRYTDQGLVCSLGRNEAGYRLFDETAVGCLRAVRALRGLGLSLDDVARLHAYHGGGAEAAGPWLLERLQRVRSDLDRRLEELRCVRDAIDAFTERHQEALERDAIEALARALGEDEAPEALRCQERRDAATRRGVDA